MSEQEFSKSIRELRARLSEDDATLVQLCRVVRGECRHRERGVCEKTGGFCLDGSKWEKCSVFNGGSEK